MKINLSIKILILNRLEMRCTVREFQSNLRVRWWWGGGGRRRNRQQGFTSGINIIIANFVYRIRFFARNGFSFTRRRRHGSRRNNPEIVMSGQPSGIRAFSIIKKKKIRRAADSEINVFSHFYERRIVVVFMGGVEGTCI